jgi:hypothetical protein
MRAELKKMEKGKVDIIFETNKITVVKKTNCNKEFSILIPIEGDVKPIDENKFEKKHTDYPNAINKIIMQDDYPNMVLSENDIETHIFNDINNTNKTVISLIIKYNDNNHDIKPCAIICIREDNKFSYAKPSKEYTDNTIKKLSTLYNLELKC